MPGDALPLDQPGVDAGSFSYGTFSGAVTWTLQVQCILPTGTCATTRGGLTGSEVLAIQVPVPDTTLVAPASSGIVNPACADSAWTAAPGSLYSVRVTAGNSQYWIYTAGTSFRVPYVLPNGSYTWTVTEATGIGTLDDATASYAAGHQFLDATTSNLNGCTEQDGFSVP